MTWMTVGHEPKVLDDMNNLELWLTWQTLGHELKALDAMNSQGYGWYVPLRVMS